MKQEVLGKVLLLHSKAIMEINRNRCVQNVPRKVSEARLAGCTHGKAAHGCPRTAWSEYNSNLAWFRLGVEPAEQSEIPVDHEVFTRAAAPATLPRGKAGIVDLTFRITTCRFLLAIVFRT